jgi:hypothetical protein
MTDRASKFQVTFRKKQEDGTVISREEDWVMRIPNVGESVMINVDGNQPNFSGVVEDIRTVVVNNGEYWLRPNDSLDVFCYYVVTLSVKDL